MAIRWVSAVMVSWAPILTFSRKRDEVLEWVEAALDPLAFQDGDTSLGLAFGEPDMKLAFTRRGVLLTSGASGHSMESLLDEPLRGILDVLTPAQTRVTNVLVRSSEGIDSESYADSARSLAERAHGRGLAASSWQATDVAVLSDVSTEGFSGQVDYGIVSPEEIRQRILNPDVSRVWGRMDAPSQRHMESRLSDVPPTSLFVDALMAPDSRDYVASSADIWQTYAEAEERILELTEALATSAPDQGERHE